MLEPAGAANEPGNKRRADYGRGALPSVVGGLVPRPVIAVPTSVGYGASLGGLAALLAMLNSCAPNVSVVNIDNGFSAGFVAALIARQAHAAGRAREARAR